MYLHNHYFSSNGNIVYTRNERKRKVSLRGSKKILKHEIEACQIIIVSRRYLSRVHGDESPILDRRAKWLQRIPFSRSTVVTFGGPKFLTLQITSTRKRKSAVYFVCWQSRTSPIPLNVRVRCWWSAVERFIEPFLPPPPSFCSSH